MEQIKTINLYYITAVPLAVNCSGESFCKISVPSSEGEVLLLS